MPVSPERNKNRLLAQQRSRFIRPEQDKLEKKIIP